MGGRRFGRNDDDGGGERAQAIGQMHVTVRGRCHGVTPESGGRKGYRPGRVESTPRRIVTVVLGRKSVLSHWSRPQTPPRPVKIRTFQPGDEVTQAALFNVAANSLAGFKPATGDEVRRRTRARSFDPTARFFAEEGGQVVGYCTLEPDQGRISYPWCKVGFESAAPLLFEAAQKDARAAGITLALRRLSPRLGTCPALLRRRRLRSSPRDDQLLERPARPSDPSHSRPAPHRSPAARRRAGDRRDGEGASPSSRREARSLLLLQRVHSRRRHFWSCATATAQRRSRSALVSRAAPTPTCGRSTPPRRASASARSGPRGSTPSASTASSVTWSPTRRTR